MMITSVPLSDMAEHNLPSQKESLLLASHTIENTATLLWCNWLAADEHWKNHIKLSALAKYYRFDAISTQPVPASELDGNDPEQQLLLVSIIQIQQYLQGIRRNFDLPIDMALGTPFQQKVWQALLDIKYGDTISYATLAQRVDNPKGYRAVANANSKNPLSIIIPCHRVIASDGKLGGYTGGVDKKEYLLALEGVKI